MRTLAIWLALHVPAPASWRPWLLGAAIGRRSRKVAGALLLLLAAPLAAQMQPDPFHLTASPEGGAGAPGEGTVTSVDMTVPSWLDVSGNPVTTSGTLAVTAVDQLANLIFAGPVAGGADEPAFRPMVAADLPATINADTTGNAGTASQLAANPADCSSGNLPRGITATGAASACAPVNLVTESTGAAPTATALAADGTNCSGVQASQGVDASGNAQGCFTPAGGSPAGSGSELQFRSTGTTFGAVTSSSVSGANVTLGGTLGGITQLNVDNVRLDDSTVLSTGNDISIDAASGNILARKSLYTYDGASVFAGLVHSQGVKIASNMQFLASSTTAATGTADVGVSRSTVGVWLDTNGSTGLGARLTGRVVEVNTAGPGAPRAVIATESRKLFTNEGTTAENHYALPSAAAGYEYVFCVQDADGIQVNAAVGDTIRLGASVSAAAGNIESTTIGNCATLVAINVTEWIGVSFVGTWTVN